MASLSVCLLKHGRSISLHAWKAFNLAHQRIVSGRRSIERSKDDDASVKRHQISRPETLKTQVSSRFYHHISLPTADNFMAYIKPLRPTRLFDFIAHICIAGSCQVRTEQLLLLPNLENLGVLEIIAPVDDFAVFPKVSDRILRSWSEQRGAFPRLAILRIHASEHLSETCLKYLGGLPALAMFEVFGAAGKWDHSERLAAEAGWVPCRRDKNTGLPLPLSSHEGRESLRPYCTRLTQHISCPEGLSRGDPGCWAFWAYTAVQREPRSVLTDTTVGCSVDDCWSGPPFATLVLGPRLQTLETSRRALLGMSLISFWRRSLFKDYSLHGISVDRDRPRAMKEQLDEVVQSGGAIASSVKQVRKAVADTQRGGSRSKKRRTAGSIGDVLSSFQA